MTEAGLQESGHVQVVEPATLFDQGSSQRRESRVLRVPGPRRLRIACTSAGSTPSFSASTEWNATAHAQAFVTALVSRRGIVPKAAPSACSAGRDRSGADSIVWTERLA